MAFNNQLQNYFSRRFFDNFFYSNIFKKIHKDKQYSLFLLIASKISKQWT